MTTPPQLVYVSLVDVRENTPPRVMHRHPDFIEIILIRNGQGQFSIDGKKVRIREGDLVVYNSGVIHDELISPETGLSWYCVAFSQVSLPGLRPNTLVHDKIRPVFPSGQWFEPLNTLCDLLFHQLVADLPGCEISAHHLGQALLAMSHQIIRSATGSSESMTDEEPLARRVIGYLDQYYADPISLQDIASAFRVSTFYLSHVFKDQFGYSLMQYILRRRIGEAQSLLISTDLSVTEIAFRVGYDNPSQFSRQFSKYVGQPPLKYRLNYLRQPK